MRLVTASGFAGIAWVRTDIFHMAPRINAAPSAKRTTRWKGSVQTMSVGDDEKSLFEEGFVL